MHRQVGMPAPHAQNGSCPTDDPNETMSDTTQAPRESGGGNRRRRSRGGQKRKRNNQNNTEGGANRRQGRQPGHGRQSGKKEGAPSSGKPRRRPMPPPAKLTWWQKFLKAFGLYKEPERPARKSREKTANDKRAPKSNTRVARPAEADSAPAEATIEPDRRPRKTRPRSEKRTGGDPDSVESSRVYVGNLSYDATEQDLKELFKGIGSVRNIEVVYDRKTHRSKGFGFVEMMNVDEAKRSVEILNDQFFMGREMVVSGAKKKGQDEREDQEDTRSETPKPVELAPLPPAAATEPDPNEKHAAVAASETAGPAEMPAEEAAPEPAKQPEPTTAAETTEATEPAELTEPTEPRRPEA